MNTFSLNGSWKLYGRPQDESDASWLALDATVPGCAQLDLSAVGYLPSDLYMGMNILELEKYETWEWRYERSFEAPEKRDRLFIVFEGVDCVADYYLNGEKFGESENAFTEHEFEIGKYVREGENTLCVHIKSPVLYTHGLDYSVKHILSWTEDVTNTGIRRPAHSYGWDIMPRAVTSGIWRGVRLEQRDEIYFSQLFALPTDDSCRILFELECDYSQLRDIKVVAQGSCGDSTFYGERVIPRGKARGKCAVFGLSFNGLRKWMPYGYGEPNVYDGSVSVYQGERLVHSEPISFGLRKVVLDRTNSTDGVNGRFRFLINGVEIMARGSNWVPMDAFHCLDAERYEKALELVRDVGCNILRCWGGNVYEDHAFFDFCDRNGIMIWQDFSMACASYPQDDRFKSLIKKEASAVIRKLRNHPSIVLWAGDNEIDELHRGIGTDPENNRITREWLPEAVDLNDPSRPYLPSSPYYAPGSTFDTMSEAHLWGPRDYFKSDFYKNSKAHFVSETGYHGCPSLESIKKFITPDCVWPYADNEEWILHSSDQYHWDARVMLMEKQVAQLFGEIPSDPERYILASQISQAEAKKYFIERIRVGRPEKTGIIWWNLLDGWPQMSDAVVDYYYSKKLAYYYIKRSQAPFTVAADEINNWNLPIYACNDTLVDRRGRLTVTDATDGSVIHTAEFFAGANASTAIAHLPILYSEQKVLIFEWELENGERGYNHYLCGYPAFSLDKYIEIMKKYRLGE